MCVRQSGAIAMLALSGAALSGCAAISEFGIQDTKFAPSSFGVSASPRVKSKKQLVKGGGRYSLGKPYKIAGKWYVPKHEPNYDKTGMASWYGPNFYGRQTANGEIYDMYALTAAHPTLPLPSYVRVTNLENGRSVVVRVNDRGPYINNRIIDLSARAAHMLDYTQKGVTRVRVQYVGRAPLEGDDTRRLLASYREGMKNTLTTAFSVPQSLPKRPVLYTPILLSDLKQSGVY